MRDLASLTNEQLRLPSKMIDWASLKKVITSVLALVNNNLELNKRYWIFECFVLS